MVSHGSDLEVIVKERGLQFILCQGKVILNRILFISFKIKIKVCKGYALKVSQQYLHEIGHIDWFMFSIAPEDNIAKYLEPFHHEKWLYLTNPDKCTIKVFRMRMT